MQMWDYHDFSVVARTIRRYNLGPQQKTFLNELLQTSASRTITLPAGHLLWRAQLSCEAFESVLVNNLVEYRRIPHSISRMKPHPDKAREGRANPKGIPCLYCSTDRETAMSEVRPWIGSLVTVAEFLLKKELKLVDFTADPLTIELMQSSIPSYLERKQVAGEEHEKLSWAWVNEAFAEPVSESDDTADYIPTQIIAEAFRLADFDGIQYGSKVGQGITVAIFDPENTEVVSRCICEVTQRQLTFRDMTTVHNEPTHPSPVIEEPL